MKPAIDEKLLEQAGEWLLRMSEEDPSPDLVRAWLEWYHADDAHLEAFDALQRDYEQFRAMPATQRLRLAEDLLADGTTPIAPAPSRRKASHSAISRPSSGARRRRGWAVAATVLLGVAAVFWQSGGRWQAGATADAHHTARGEHRQLELPDGSRLALGAESSATYRFTADARYIVLESGEAYFEVAPDRRRPFIVNAGGMTVRAVGTAFNVRRSVDRVVVTVSEGRVDVRRAESSSREPDEDEASYTLRTAALRLSAGQEAVVDLAEQPRMLVSRADVEAAVAWRSRRMEFLDEPLVSVVSTVNRYYSRDIVITDRSLGRMSLTGSVMDGHIDEWLESLQDAFPVQVTTLDDTVLISPRGGEQTQSSP